MDTPHLFACREHLPPHSLSVFVPLCDLRPANGPTEFHLASHIKAADALAESLLRLTPHVNSARPAQSHAHPFSHTARRAPTQACTRTHAPDCTRAWRGLDSVRIHCAGRQRSPADLATTATPRPPAQPSPRPQANLVRPPSRAAACCPAGASGAMAPPARSGCPEASRSPLA